MARYRRTLIGRLAAVALLLAATLLVPSMAKAAPYELVSHDANEIRAYLQTDGDVTITLDGDVDEDFDGIYDHPYWCELGTGNKTVDLAGYEFHVTPRWADGNALWMFAVTSPSTTFTINDSSADGSGEIAFGAYLGTLTRGWAGSHASDYYPVHVQHRNIIFVGNGSFIMNGGTLVAGRRKSEYLGFGINARDLQEYLNHGHTASLRYDGDVTKCINSVGITIEGGVVLINGGTVEGRGYREVVTGGPANHYYNTYTPAAAIRADGGVLVINDGTFAGYTAANCLDISATTNVSIRAGNFITTKSGRVAVPHPSNSMFGGEDNPYDSMFGGGEYGSNAPLFISPAEGMTGIRPEFLDADMVDVVVDGETVPTSNWDAQFNINQKDDVSIVPTKNGHVTLIDSRTSTEIEGREVSWDGTSPCSILVPVEQTFTGYPWMDHYWVVVAQSTKSNPEGTSPTVIMGGQTLSVPDAAPVEREVGYNSSYEEVKPIINSGSGTLSFNLAELVPEGVGEGESFIVDFIVCQNLQPNGTGGYSQYLNCTRAIVVNIETKTPTITAQPESVYEEDTSNPVTTLTAQAEGATGVYWVQEWPVYQVLTGSFDDANGIATLDVGITNSACYYSCHFYNDYGTVSTDTVSVRYALNSDIAGTDTAVTFYTDEPGELVVTGDLMAAFMSVGPEDREVHWYRLNGEERIPINYESGNRIIPSTPHYQFGTPSSADEGTYLAVVKIRLNGEWQEFETGTYTVTVVEGSDPTVIQSIELFGVGHPYLGDPIPEAITASDERYTIESVNWNGTSGGVYSVPTAYFEVRLKAAEGYTFANAGAVPVTLDGFPIGTASMGNIPNTTSYISYTFSTPGHIELLPRTGLEEVTFSAAPGEEISISLNSSMVFTNYGVIGADESVVASSFSASSLPAWATLSADGVLTGTVPSDASVAQIQSAVTYRTSTSGSVPINSGITLMITGLPNYMELPEDASLRRHVHSWGAWVDSEDGMTHTRTCKTCGGSETQDHLWDEGEYADDVLTYTCTLCGASREDSAVARGHGPLEPVDEVPATCTDDGTKAHYRCIECGRLFWDEDGLESVMGPDDLVIPATGHDWGEWETVTKPTADSPGEQRRVCANDETHVETRTTFLITYNLNGGTLDGKTGTVELVVPEGETITLPAPTRDGYTFDYWEGSRYEAGASYTVTGSHAFTAQWAKGDSPKPHVLPRTWDDTIDVMPIVAVGVAAMILALFVRRKKG